jgi:tetratricopeptide (TPR) repeat protein
MMLLVVVAACSRAPETRSRALASRLRATDATSTSRKGLAKTVAGMRARLAIDAGDTQSAVALADALLRQTRVEGSGALAVEAERVLVAALARHPDRYDARRMLATVYLSQHRFREALKEASRCLSVRTDDDWIHGVIGDANIELGNYDDAFAAIDRMNAEKPTAASYARASYARELQGDRAGALELMKMAAEATTPRDPESIAWHHAELGQLYLAMGQISDARREFSYADFVFRGHPLAVDGLARVATALGEYSRALQIVRRRLQTAPLPDDLALAGDLLSVLGQRDEAERHYRLAEIAWRTEVPDPSRLARFLAERGRRLDEAVRLAELAREVRRDIFTADALAWAYFQQGQFDRARTVIGDALRTGTRDRVILYHAAAIEHAVGNRDAAARYVGRALDGAPRFDLIAAPAAARLARALGAPVTVTANGR